MFTTKTARMVSYSKQINRQWIFFSINVKLTNTLLRPVNKMDVRNTARQTLWLLQVGESFLLWLLTTMMLEIALWGWVLAFLCGRRKLTGALVWDLTEGNANSVTSSPRSGKTTGDSAKSSRVLKAWAHVLWRRALFHKALFFWTIPASIYFNIFLPSIKSFKAGTVLLHVK